MHTITCSRSLAFSVEELAKEYTTRLWGKARWTSLTICAACKERTRQSMTSFGSVSEFFERIQSQVDMGLLGFDWHVFKSCAESGNPRRIE